MCGGLFDLAYTEVRLDLDKIFAYEIGQIIDRNVNAIDLPSNGVPNIVYGDTLANAEEQMVKCLLTYRTGVLRVKLDVLENANEAVRISDDEDLPGTVLGQHSKAGSQHYIELNREVIRETSDGYYNDTPAQESLLYSKHYIESVVHEFCHAFGEHHEGLGEDNPGTILYQTSDNGECIKNIFTEVLNEFPPSHNKLQLNTQGYPFNFACIDTVIANYPDYFKSMSSAAAARKTYPTFDVEYSPHDKP
jgi:hypothetical protein